MKTDEQKIIERKELAEKLFISSFASAANLDQISEEELSSLIETATKLTYKIADTFKTTLDNI